MDQIKSYLELLVKNYKLPEFLADELLIFLYTILFLYFIFIFINKQIKNYYFRKIAKNDLFPFFTYSDIKNYTKYYIPQYYQNISPTDGDEPGILHAAAAKSKILKEFLNRKLLTTSDYKYFIILADSGMGKTAFSVNLFLKYKQKKYLFKSHKYEIKLIPVGYNGFLDKIREIENKNNTILILDAFDEDLNAIQNYKRRLNEILDNVKEFRKVIITCRTQFFPHRLEEPHDTNDITFGNENKKYKIHKLYLSAFDNKDIISYLSKKYKVNLYMIFRSYQIVSKSPKLMFRPMLLKYTDDIINSKFFYKYSFSVYEQLISKWIKREANKPAIGNRSRTTFYEEDLLEFSHKLAVNLYENRFERGGYKIPHKELERLNKNSIIETALLLEDQTGRSLLNRNSEGEYKFSHKSILEYFLADEMFNNAKFYKDFEFHGMDLSYVFYQEMITNFINSNNCIYKINNELFRSKKNNIKKEDIDKVVELKIINPDLMKTNFIVGLKKLKKLEIRNKNFLELYLLYLIILFKDNFENQYTTDPIYKRIYLGELTYINKYLNEILIINPKININYVKNIFEDNELNINKDKSDQFKYFLSLANKKLTVENLDEFRKFRKTIIKDEFYSKNEIEKQISFINQLRKNIDLNNQIEYIF